jgi:FkbM family methyltransferase
MCRILRAVGDSLKGLLTLLPDAILDRLPVLGRIQVCAAAGCRLYLRTYGKAGKDRIAFKVWRHGLSGYEPETFQVFQALLGRSRFFVDIGANTGLFSLVAALDPARIVLAFEPVPQVYRMLRANIRLNGMNNLTAEPLAVSDHVGEVEFFVTYTRGGIPTDSSSVPGFRSRVGKLALQAVTLDSYLRDKALGPVDLLKIDVETAEPRVLRGALQTLRRDRPVIICEVLECVDHEAIHAVMAPLNYRYFHLTPAGPVHHDRLRGNPGRGHRNYLFVPCEQVQAICNREGLQAAAV